jgi:Tfp pilus assembly protein PilX
MRVSSEALQEIEAALREYEQEVESSNMTPATQHTYLLHSENFVKWLKGEFVPGARKR